MKSKWTLEEVEKNNSNEIPEPITENEERPLKIEYIEPESIKNSRDIIEKAYFDSSNNYPGIIGYSGGKDSTFLLQLVIDTLLKGKSNSSKLKRKVCIVCSNTKVENPIVDQRNELIRKLFSKGLVKEKLMDVFSFTFVEAIPSESFGVNLIGRGYPAPNQTFRGCTHRLKIKPMSEMVDKLLEKYKKVVTVLGLRYEESKSRERSMKKHEDEDGIYSRSTHSKDTFVFSPIRHIKLMEIGKHLINTPPPLRFWQATK